MIDESAIERELELAERIKGRENRHRWLLAMLADRIVGRRIEGLTKEFGRRCGVKEDSVEQWAKAWRLYVVIRYMSGRWAANQYRNEFTVSHFYAMWMLGHKYKLRIDQIVRYFSLMIFYKLESNRWSVDVLRQEIDADHSDGSTVNWRWHWKRITGDSLRALLSFDGELPLVVRAWARMGLGLKDKVK